MSELGQVFAVALVAALIGPVILLLGLGTPFRGLGLLIAYLRLSFLVFLPTLTGGLASLVLVTGLSVDLRAAPLAAAATAAAVLITKYWQFGPLSRLRRSMTDLAIPARQGNAVSLLVDALERLRPRAPADRPLNGAYPELALAASAQLISAGFFRQAEEICASIPEAWLSGIQSTHRANNLAVCRMRLGNLPGARQALDLAKQPERRAELNILQTSRAMLLMLESKFEDALLIVRDDRHIDPVTRMTALVVRAHCLAATGDKAGCTAALEQLGRSFGPEAIEAVIHNPGPATEQAILLRAKLGGPK